MMNAKAEFAIQKGLIRAVLETMKSLVNVFLAIPVLFVRLILITVLLTHVPQTTVIASTESTNFHASAKLDSRGIFVINK